MDVNTDERREGFIDLGQRMSTMEGNVDLLTKICGKIDETVEKIRDVSIDFTRIVATHEERLRNHEDTTEALAVSLEDHKHEDKLQFTKLNDKIDGVVGIVVNKTDFGQFKSDFDQFKKWAYLLIGGGMVLIWFLENFWQKFFP